MDFTFALSMLLLLSPLLLLISSLLLLCQGFPIFFIQSRPGLYGKPFSLIKFRTMSNARDVTDALLPDQHRLTRFGILLRNSSLDELPELINILRGDMSFIGPRPLLLQYLACYSPFQARRHEVQPGFSGWAQINGRNAISWEEKFRLDVCMLTVRVFGLTRASF